MKVLREENYFEPRCVGANGLQWYGERYYDTELSRYYEKTVYIRDDGKQLHVFEMKQEEYSEEKTTIKVLLCLICSIQKKNQSRMYGRKRR